MPHTYATEELKKLPHGYQQALVSRVGQRDME